MSKRQTVAGARFHRGSILVRGSCYPSEAVHQEGTPACPPPLARGEHGLGGYLLRQLEGQAFRLGPFVLVANEAKFTDLSESFDVCASTRTQVERLDFDHP